VETGQEGLLVAAECKRIGGDKGRTRAVALLAATTKKDKMKIGVK